MPKPPKTQNPKRTQCQTLHPSLVAFELREEDKPKSPESPDSPPDSPPGYRKLPADPLKDPP